MRYRDIIETNVVNFPSPDMPDELTSFTNMMIDPRPIHALYQKGDVLTYKGMKGRVVGVNPDSIVLALPNGDQIIPRNDPDLDVAPYHEWTFDLDEGIDYSTMQGPDTARFVQDNEPSLFKRHSRIRYFDPSEVTKESHVMAFDGKRVVGVGGMQVNPHDPEQLWIKFISVDPEYRERGIGKTLLRHIYDFAKLHGHKMAPGGFTEEGERLRHLHDILDREYPEVAYDRDERGNYVSGGKIVRSAD